MQAHNRLLLGLLSLRLLMFPAYRSTDFEVHRHWLATTYSLPLAKWYSDTTSQWTLDYPPLFAWFEWLLAQAAVRVDPGIVQLSNLEYASQACIFFQRCSVMASELILLSAVKYATRRGSRDESFLLYLLILGSPGLIIVDHIHFQYNGMMLGLLLWSILLIQQQQHILGSMVFAVLVNMKHLYASLGPVYLVYLLRSYCRGAQAVQRFTMLGISVVSVCGISFGPFIIAGQLPQILERLFPFGRGLCHAYWAANFWALYSFADKALASLLPRLGFAVAAPEGYMTGGLVQVTSFAVLPSISPAFSLILVLLAMLPCLLVLWRQPQPKLLLSAAAYASLCSFMFGYHVHEKAILAVTIPLALQAVQSKADAGLYFLLSTAGHVALMPLLFTAAEYPVKVLLILIHSLVSYALLDKSIGSAVRSQLGSHFLPRLQRLYLIGFVPLEMFCSGVHPLVLGTKLPFLPLLMTSVYSSVGVSFCWLQLVRVWLDHLALTQSQSEAKLL